MSESFSIPTSGDEIAGKYVVKEELGRGAYGVVFRAEQTNLKRNVALKTLLPQAFLQVDIVERFHREAQLISRLDHANVIKLYDYGVDEGLLYMAVEYVEGKTLAEVIENEAPLPPSRVRELMVQILDALAYAHSVGIVHRDLKPDNILLLELDPGQSEYSEVVKILDFGIAKLVQDEQGEGALKTLTQDGAVLGTPHYMSPENIVGDTIDHRTDLYAVGVLLYELLVGEHPFEAPTPSAVMVRHLRDEPPELPEVYRGTAFEVAVSACLEKQPLDRVESAAHLLQILSGDSGISDKAAREGLAMPPVELDQPEHVPESEESSSSKSVRRAAIIAALLGVILVASVGWKVWYAFKEASAGSESTPTAVVIPTDVPDTGDVEETTPGDLVEDGVAAGFDFDEDTGLNLSGDHDAGEDATIAEETPEEADDKDAVATATQDRKKPREDRQPQAPVVEKVTLSIRSDPPNASVSVDGVHVGNTPLESRIDRGDEPVTIRLSLLGYKNETYTVTPSQDSTLEADLQFDRIKMFD